MSNNDILNNYEINVKSFKSTFTLNSHPYFQVGNTKKEIAQDP